MMHPSFSTISPSIYKLIPANTLAIPQAFFAFSCIQPPKPPTTPEGNHVSHRANTMSQTVPELGDKRNGQSSTVDNDNIKPTRQQIDNLNRYATHTSVAVPMDVYEKMYLNPETRVKGQLRNTFANPTPL